MYVKAVGKVIKIFPYSIHELIRDNPNTSFPEQMSDEVLARFNVYPVILKEIPQPFDYITQNAAIVNPVFVDGKWIQTWEISSASSEEVTQRIDNLIQSVRNTRFSLLVETDWTALSDVTMTPQMAEYRQALRDVTKQSGYPTNVIWPIKPA